VLRRESVARDTLESPKTKMTVGGDVDDAKSQRLQQSSCVERVTGIEPALSAWEELLSHRVSVSCNDIGGLS
jgi:hypothetical protein